MRVLIADDSELMRELVRSLLEAVGIREIRGASHADMAWEILTKMKPDLVITDWNMPPTSGLDFVNRIRKDRDSPNPFLPVIMLTGYNEQDRVMAARDAGVTEFVIKPITAATLHERLRAVADDTRNFVKSPSFFGPDRRRGRRGAFAGKERREP